MADPVTPPAPMPTPSFPAWAMHIAGILLSVALAFIAAKWGVTPAPIPTTFGTQSQPMLLVIHTGGGQPAYTGAVGCQCEKIEAKAK